MEIYYPRVQPNKMLNKPTETHTPIVRHDQNVCEKPMKTKKKLQTKMAVECQAKWTLHFHN